MRPKCAKLVEVEENFQGALKLLLRFLSHRMRKVKILGHSDSRKESLPVLHSDYKVKQCSRMLLYSDDQTHGYCVSSIRL